MLHEIISINLMNLLKNDTWNIENLFKKDWTIFNKLPVIIYCYFRHINYVLKWKLYNFLQGYISVFILLILLFI